MAEQKKGLFSGNLFAKILILISAGVIISAILFGIPSDLISGFWFIVRIIVGILFFILAMKIIQQVVTGKDTFSPTKSWRSKLIPLAEMSKPPRTKKLWMRGEDMHVHYFFGRITGLLFLPNWAGVPIVDPATKKFRYVHKCDKLGNPLYDNDGKPVMGHELANINERDGDWLFVVTRGFFPALSKKILVRAGKKFCSDIGENVWIKTVNLVPVGDYHYPHQQWQADIVRINMQHLAETVEETAQHFLDLYATTTEVSIKLDPTYVKMMNANTEQISSKESAPIQSLGQKG